MLSWLGFEPRAARAQARALVAAAARAARQPGLYGEGRVADTFSGRFEMAALFAIVLTRRMAGEDPRLAQAVANRIFATFDEALREVGEGDLTVAKRMKGLARAFYGRLHAYDAALTGESAPALSGALSRNVWNADEAVFAGPLAAYIIEVDSHLAKLPLTGVSEPFNWPPAVGL